MANATALGDLLSTLLDRKLFPRRGGREGHLPDLCRKLLAETSEASGLQLAASILETYRQLPAEGRIAFYRFLNDDLDIDANEVARLASIYAEDPCPENFRNLSRASEPKRQDLFRRLNQAPGATAELVAMRADLLSQLAHAPELGRTDHDLVHLLRSWFNRGFLVLRQITWDTPASILERIIAYEAVHEIHTWDDLRRRLQPADRRCFAFFHPAMPDDPLIFVEVALTDGVPGSIQGVLSDNRTALPEEAVNTAVFYSISNCQAGLAGISFGNSLIKQVVRDLSRDLPGLKKFVTLSPIPGLSRWLAAEGLEAAQNDPTQLRRMAALYLLDAKKKDGRPLDPVARFHLANGATVHQIHSEADVSDKGIALSGGAMVNYLYDLSKIAQNSEAFGQKNEIAATTALRALARQAAKNRNAISGRPKVHRETDRPSPDVPDAGWDEEAAPPAAQDAS
ncbi:malonyl-CoA decarboxylase [Oceanomicrobium pacificus]|uniref:Decarboxylase n=1 Tax=Oceanomicrobium pacificus TaxID=2692916 RepID=A0A6B0TVT7_9RHOB|nr:malonyl-CoA decarboxylase [Oceanomicrobium pacificus]MXU65103.1 decarboxylase [Oceanomicrobium pacificus]